METHNVYHHDRMVQVGPYFVHKDIYDGYFYPPKPENYAAREPALSRSQTFLLVLGLVIIGMGIGFLIPV